MNEKIKELAEKAGGCPVGDPAFDNSFRFRERALERFVELIVSECAQVELYWLCEEDRKSIAEKIKQHFVVK